MANRHGGTRTTGSGGKHAAVNFVRTQNPLRIAIAAAAVTALGAVVAGPAWGESSPVRGNPMDSLPKIEAPKVAAPAFRLEAPSQEQAVQALLARKIVPKRFGIEGVKSIPFAPVAALFAPLAGKEVTIGDLVEKANEVTAMYQKAGYLLSFGFVPAQDFKDGFVRVTVVEGYVASTKITGSPGPSEARLHGIAQHIEAERPLTRTTFERYLNLLTLVPGMQVKADLKPPTQTDGATELSLDVSRKPVTVGTSLSYNNPGIRALVTVTSNALTPLGEQIQLTAIAPKGHNNEEFYAAAYTQPLGTDGLTAKVDASHYRGQPDDKTLTAQGLERHLDNKRIGVSVSYPILLNNQRSLTASGGMYGVDNRDRYEVPNSPNNIDSRTHVRAAQVQLAYNEVTETQSRSASVAIYKGFTGFGASQSFTTVPAGVPQTLGPYDLSFIRYTVDARQGWVLPHDFGVVVGVGGQYSNNTVPTSEQATFGGVRYGLGYPAGEIAGDSGWGASLEFNRLFRTDFKYLKTVQPFIVFDTARVYVNRGVLTHNKLASFGIGTRISDAKHYTFDLSFSKPVADAPSNANNRPVRFNANYSYQFD
ncbi:ShlB/FhaC/HecB family hemolysin secretion/activation protein [Pandoraea terrae]|uniref:ShlB/FhaC/HecB family hemolysin secretion/activation protein n=1 Tax=Pandoraea terrae TaxID=1537710 RepID=A0A5E4YKL9_9BURK|nr:POTRA domain-containing protein [Pandoraea terrae]VVE48828.1 ShlB/FhaC/HecB family hemolysin secretion/activation protein [Pandoraea terrae]